MYKYMTTWERGIEKPSSFSRNFRNSTVDLVDRTILIENQNATKSTIGLKSNFGASKKSAQPTGMSTAIKITERTATNSV